MSDWISATRVFLIDFLEAHQYLALAGYVAVEEAGVPFPVPADTAIMLMGYQVYRGVANPVAIVVVVVCSATAGASALYWISRLIGPRVLDKYGRVLHITPERRHRAERWIRRHEVPAVVIGRLIPGFRIVITVVAGTARTNFLAFLPSAALSALIWVVIYMALGWALGDQYEKFSSAIDTDPRVGFVIVIGAIGIVAAIVAFRLRRRIMMGLRG